MPINDFDTQIQSDELASWYYKDIQEEKQEEEREYE